MKTRSRKRIALAVPQGLTLLEQLIHGITDYAKQNTSWSFTRVPEMLGTSIDWLRHWHGDGAFALIVTPGDARLARRLTVPVVNLATRMANLKLPSVGADDMAMGTLAAEHLLGRNFHRFGYFGPSDLYYAQLRRDGFCATVARAGGECEVFEVESVLRLQQTWNDQQMALEQWLAHLKLPVGILASSDLRAAMVLEACHTLKLRIPEDVSVIGVDNDPVVCDFCDPPLTSVSRNDYQTGFEAAALLDRLIGGDEPPSEPVAVPPAGVVQRRSTDTMAVEDPAVAQIIRFMRENVSEPFGVAQLLKTVRMSRRTLEYRFRACLGRSPYDTLNRIRVEQAKQILADPQPRSLTSVATACGFGDLRRFRIVFQRLVGMTPVNYRKAAFHIGESKTAASPAKRKGGARVGRKGGQRPSRPQPG